MRVFHRNKKPIYPVDEWRIIENFFVEEYIIRNESIFSLGNGYLGMRGNLEEGFAKDVQSCRGTYINGFYESERIFYGEYQYAFPNWGQTMLNVMDAKSIELWIEDEKFTMDTGEIENYNRVLDMREGKLTRSLIWKSPRGKKIALDIERFISFQDLHTAVIKYSFQPLNFSGRLTVRSRINGNVRNGNLRERALITEEWGCKDNILYMMQRTKKTQFGVSCGVLHDFVLEESIGDIQIEYTKIEDEIAQKWEIQGEIGKGYTLYKYIYYDTYKQDRNRDILQNCLKGVNKARQKGYGDLFNEHKQILDDFWGKTDVTILGDASLQQGIRFNMFHLFQSTGRDGYTNIAAKGLTGEGYEGHYFWDTETYIFPFFLYSNPEISRSLLIYRYHTLDAARNRARELDHPGALYAWRTIDGDEASAYFEASTAQYHINADIVYAIKKYVEVTEDKEFLLDYGAEIVWETARLWADRGGFIPLRNNQFCIHEVTGPDEYKPGVNNNCYTNYMAQMHLYYAVELVDWMRINYQEKFEEIKKKISLKEEEVVFWKKAADHMYLPYSEELGIHPQDDSFIYKEYYDIDSIPANRLPLVFNWHPLNIWRYQICKQADVLLLMFLLGDQFSQQLKRANFDYYEPKTIHDSSLSACIFSVIASEIGYKDYAYNYFMQTARMDLDDYNNNVYQGVHTACMAGAWMCVINGFAGMRVHKGELYFNPYLPEKWEGYAFHIWFKGRRLRIEINQEGVVYFLAEGDLIEFYHRGEKVRLSAEDRAKKYVF